jgi:hypothetical protein
LREGKRRRLSNRGDKEEDLTEGTMREKEDGDLTIIRNEKKE